ncbi:transmembrane protein 11, mitochondrial-like [Balaenoptera acutorostrata]|uniref:Transmembrane protein 11, mitochondrial-like n=1 Tax=Balaenoptera acutorostrata TaxID=9767 RepID=A0A384AZ60_BALAC|nr:transmembrane protein 11, mitochondrial-like [Balaenoptera acutorostrata]
MSPETSSAESGSMGVCVRSFIALGSEQTLRDFGRWITVGNCLHKTTVLADTACLFTPLALPLDYSHYISLPTGVLSLACCTLYGIFWHFDPCCKYLVEYDAYRLSRLPLHTLTSSSRVVLVLKDDLHRKRRHNAIALAALVYYVKKIYELCAV